MIIVDTSAFGFRPATGQGYDGVALLRAGGNLGTASLLYDGRALGGFNRSPRGGGSARRRPASHFQYGKW